MIRCRVHTALVVLLAQALLSGCQTSPATPPSPAPAPSAGSASAAQSSGPSAGLPGPNQVASQVVVGAAHACALEPDGTVACWGANRFGQLGVEGHEGVGPVSPAGLPPVASLAASENATCAVTRAGELYCWGRGAALGVEGSLFRQPILKQPHKVADLTDLSHVAMGPDEACATLANGKVRCWKFAERYDIAELDSVEELTMGAQACARKADGHVFCFQAAEPSKPPVKRAGVEGAVAISANARTACAVLKDGAVLCWPARDLARALGVEDAKEPLRIPGVGAATAISLGSDSTCVIEKDERVRCWGTDDHGQLGRSKRSFVRFAKPGEPVVGIAGAKSLHGSAETWCAVSGPQGRVRCWGRASGGVLGAEHRAFHATPQRVAGVSDAVELALGWDYSCALHKAGTLSCWGLDTSTGPMSNEPFVQRAHVPLELPTKWKHAWPSKHHVMGQSDSGKHQLLTTTRSNLVGKKPSATEPSGLPALRNWLPSSPISGYALTTRGDFVSYKAAGENLSDFAPSTIMSGVASAAVASNVGCVVKPSGEALCFTPSFGKTLSASDLQPMKGLTGVQLLRASGATVAALHRDGTITVAKTTFGLDRVKLQRVGEVKGAVDIGLGQLGARGCAVSKDGALRCWGRPMRPAWADGPHSAPTPNVIPSEPFAGVRDAKQVRFGLRHACVLHRHGGVSCWGDNSSDQLGAPAPPFSATPVVVLE